MKKPINFILSGLLVCCLAYVTVGDRHYDLQGVASEEKVKHICKDKTHVWCDGSCECDGLGCQFSREGGDK